MESYFKLCNYYYNKYKDSIKSDNDVFAVRYE